MSSTLPTQPQDAMFQGERVALLGKLAGMPRREAQQILRQQGSELLDTPSELATLLVVGEKELPLNAAQRDGLLPDEVRTAVDRGDIEVIAESEFWQRLGLVEQQQHSQQLYTPAMLADLLDVPVAIVRRWHRRGLIVPAREVRRLPYFDFKEIATARRLAELLATGMTPVAIERQLADLARLVPGVQRPLAQLSTIVKGKHLLLRQGEGLIASGGQLWFDFDAVEEEPLQPHFLPASELCLPARGINGTSAPSPDELLRMAGELEDNGDLMAAADMYRAALAAGGPNSQVCFLLAELLYRLGDLHASRERYYVVLELDEEYVEARANLGCVLTELGESELAVAAFSGALAFHPEYADAHYHLARTLDDLQRGEEAEEHWRRFLSLAPESPWAAEARLRLGLQQ